MLSFDNTNQQILYNLRKIEEHRRAVERLSDELRRIGYKGLI